MRTKLSLAALLAAAPLVGQQTGAFVVLKSMTGLGKQGLDSGGVN